MDNKKTSQRWFKLLLGPEFWGDLQWQKNIFFFFKKWEKNVFYTMFFGGFLFKKSKKLCVFCDFHLEFRALVLLLGP